MSTLGSVWATIQAWQGPLTLLAVFFGPSLVQRAYRLFHDRHRPPPLPLSPVLLAILSVHVAFAAYQLASPAYDVFVTHKLKILVPSDILRPIVMRAAGLRPTPTPQDPTESEHPLVELLLARLTSREGRYAYARWGHVPFTRCVWCKDSTDFALAAIPDILAPYAAEAVLIGIMGWNWVAGPTGNMRAKELRAPAGWAVAALAAADYAARWIWDIRAVNGDCFHLSTTISTLRTIALALVTAGYVLAPVRLSDKEAIERGIRSTLEAALARARLASLARLAIARSPAMARLAASGTEARARADEKARTDPAVIQAANDAGMYSGSEPPPQAREAAHAWVSAEWAKIKHEQQHAAEEEEGDE